MDNPQIHLDSIWLPDTAGTKRFRRWLFVPVIIIIALGFAWWCWYGQRSEITSFDGHANGVVRVAFTSDGRQISTVDGSGTIRFWDISAGSVLRHVKVQGRIGPLSPDLRTMLTVLPKGLQSNDTLDQLVIWDTETGQKVRSFENEMRDVYRTAFSPDGSRVIAGGGGFRKDTEGKPIRGNQPVDCNARLWDVKTGMALMVFKGHSKELRCVALSPDGRHALTGSLDGTIRLWDAQTGEQERIFKEFKGWPIQLAFTPDGKRFLSSHECVEVASENAVIRLWDADSGEELLRITGHSDLVWGLAFSADGRRFLSGSHDYSVRLWDLETGEMLRSFKGHTAGVSCVTFSPDGRQALSGSWDDTARLWKLPP